MAKRKIAYPACAACRMQRKKCSEECVFAPHFPSNDPEKFAVAQSVFGTSHTVKLLQGLKAEQRADAVYEATARVDDPVHECVSSIHQMKKRIAELEADLAATQEELVRVLHMFLLGTDDALHVAYPSDTTSQPIKDNMYEEADPLQLWRSLWEQ
ncbi:hypothetical protein KI387_002965 [Taxus chinensis]|uniref:LOB domain-containing protein n=1 Tax=Taxus chinensis TaxID=29808 RepID=A0AA38GZV5_TAXCH|nr:hypothetical protein KI387_002965 [Taxus chinensis]